LIIPKLNDREEDFQELTDWIAQNLGEDTPLHFSRYFPAYKTELAATPTETLKRAEAIAKQKLRYVYLGNV
jgi:pyruvate formate lyase activating enzyme